MIRLVYERLSRQLSARRGRVLLRLSSLGLLQFSTRDAGHHLAVGDVEDEGYH